MERTLIVEVVTAPSGQTRLRSVEDPENSWFDVDNLSALGLKDSTQAYTIGDRHRITISEPL